MKGVSQNMRLLTTLLLATVSLFADTVGPNATKIPPVRRQSAVKHAAAGAKTPALKMPNAKHNGKKGNSKTPAQKGGAISRALASGRAAKTAPPRLK